VAPRLELVLELGLTESHGVALGHAIPAFARRLGALLTEQGVTHGTTWSGGSNRRISAVVNIASSTPPELLIELLPAFLERTFNPQTQLRTSTSKAPLRSRVHSLTFRLGSALLPIRLGTLAAVSTARGVDDTQRIAWSAEEGYLASLRAVGIELDVGERVRAIQSALAAVTTRAWAPFEPASEVVEAWVLDGERVCCEELTIACDVARLPPELMAELAAKHRSVPVADDADGGTLRVLAVACSNSITGASALADECRRATALYWAALQAGSQEVASEASTQPRSVALDGVVQLCQRLAVLLGVSSEVLESSLRAAPYLIQAQGTDLVLEFPRLLGVVTCEIAQRAGASEATLELLRVHHRARFDGPASPTLEAAALLSLADNLSVLMKAAATGTLPAGSLDPHRARARAIDVLTTLLDRAWDVRVVDIVETAASIRGALPGVGVAGADERLVGFLRHRMRGLLDQAAPGRPEALGFDAELDSPVQRARRLQISG
jgi:glycyl-tRNA synthetase beta subunit